MIIVGSQALAHQTKLKRTPQDYDLVCFASELTHRIKSGEITSLKRLSENKYAAIKDGAFFEFEIISEENSAFKLAKLMEKHAVGTINTPIGSAIVPDLNVLLTLKMSHRYKKNSSHFQKTMDDIWLLRSLGASIQPDMVPFLKQREKETYYYSHPSLNQGKKEFFRDSDGFYVYDHDSIHRAVAIGPRPAYSYFIKDGAEVQCDKSKFFNIPKEIQINSILEESYVLAIERSIVPYPGGLSPTAAFNMALEKVCTSITSGWWREFAWENYFEAKDRFDPNYVDKFNEALVKGQILPYK